MAWWRMRTGTWGGRALALILAAPVVVALLGPVDATLPESAFSLGASAAALLASEGGRRGSQTAAVALLVGFIGFKVLLWLAGYAPHDFHVGERFSHGGHDAVHLARRNGTWVITGLAYTGQPDRVHPGSGRKVRSS